MTNYQFLRSIYDLLHDIMFDEIIDNEFARIGFNNVDKSNFWNNALVNSRLNTKQIEEIEEIFLAKDRLPALYFEHRKGLTLLMQDLIHRKYKKSFEDSWMFFDSSQKNSLDFSGVKKVETESELQQFLETFNACYQKDDPQNPYGELGDYLAVSETVWHKHHASSRLEYFMIFRENKPVAVSTLNNAGGVGYISNVGSLQSVRGQGFGKLATLCCVQESIKRGNKIHCLTTEEGTYPNEFYKRIGFKKEFTSICYAKAV